MQLQKRMQVTFLVVLAACPSPNPMEEERTTDVAPASIVYDGGPFSAEVGEAFLALRPRTTGGLPTRFSLTPALPAGMTFDERTGEIAGTPTAVAAAADFTARAENDVGGVETTVRLEVLAGDLAPDNLMYDQPTGTYVVGAAILDNHATLTGTAPFSFSIVPALPAGLSLNTTTGTISGTPSVVSASTMYTVTASNSKGSVTAQLTLAVSATLLAPNLTGYSTNNASYFVNVMVAPNQPVLAATSGAVASYAINPATLPAGLSFSTVNGRITGTPTDVFDAATFTVTATNATGTDTVDITLAVTALDPPTVDYPDDTLTYVTPGTRIPTLTPTVTGTSVAYAISPALPAGVNFSTTTGVISGVPTAIALANAGPFTITATNAAGSDSDMLNMTWKAASDVSVTKHDVTVTAAGSAPGFTVSLSGGGDVSAAVGEAIRWTPTGVSDAYNGWGISLRPTSPADAWNAILFTSAVTLGLNTAGDIGYEFHSASHASVDAGGTIDLP